LTAAAARAENAASNTLDANHNLAAVTLPLGDIQSDGLTCLTAFAEEQSSIPKPLPFYMPFKNCGGLDTWCRVAAIGRRWSNALFRPMVPHPPHQALYATLLTRSFSQAKATHSTATLLDESSRLPVNVAFNRTCRPWAVVSLVHSLSLFWQWCGDMGNR
jgi:hypothetical protein